MLGDIETLASLPEGRAVHVLGTITFSDHLRGRLFLQDKTSAIEVRGITRTELAAGTEVEVTGALAGADAARRSLQARFIAATSWRTLGVSALPSAEPGISGLDNARAPVRTVINAIVRTARFESGKLLVDATENGKPISLAVAGAPNVDVKSLVDSKVRAAGVGEVSQTSVLGGESITLWVPRLSDFSVEEAPRPPTVVPSIHALIFDERIREPGHRVTINGRVVGTTKPGVWIVRDGDALIPVETSDGNPDPHDYAPGDPVAVTGWPVQIRYTVVIEGAVIRKTTGNRISPANVSLSTITSVLKTRQLGQADAGRGYPVRVTGVVTLSPADPQHYYILQDQTGSIFVDAVGQDCGLKSGQHVTITGNSARGGFAPIVIHPSCQLLGPGTMPVPIQVTPEKANSGELDAAYVELIGIVHRLNQLTPTDLTLDIATSLGTIPVWVRSADVRDEPNPQRMIDSKIIVRGILGTVFNGNQQLSGFRLTVDSIHNLKVLAAPAADPFASPPKPIADLLRFTPAAEFGRRVHVRGTIRLVGSDTVYIEDATGGLDVHIDDVSPPKVGDLVDASGYANHGEFSPRLDESELLLRGRGNAAGPRYISVSEAMSGDFSNRLVSIDADLVGHVDSRTRQTLVLRSGSMVFTAEMEGSFGAKAAAIDDASAVRVVGICRITAQTPRSPMTGVAVRIPVAFRLLIPSETDVVVLRKVPWLTARRAVEGTMILALGAGLALVWVYSLRRRVRLQTRTIEDRLMEACTLRAAAETAREESEASRNLAISHARLAAIGQMAASIAHEINNPLTVIGASAHNLARMAESGQFSLPAVVKHAGRISQTAERMARIVNSLLHISRDESQSGFETVRAEQIVRECLELSAERFRVHSIRLNTPAVDPRIMVPCRFAQIGQILLNLLQNAFDAVVDTEGEKWVTLEVTARNGDAVFAVSDSGPGIAPEARQRIMEPFFTTKAAGKGTGLGLSISRSIAEAHSGRLELSDVPGPTCFLLTLPLAREEGSK